jgi:hypothetical protein
LNTTLGQQVVRRLDVRHHQDQAVDGTGRLLGDALANGDRA